MFQDVHVMIFVGFGFLMTFLRHHSWSAVCFNFLVSAFAIQVCILFIGMWHSVFCKEEGHCDKIYIDVPMLVRADFGAGAVMITFGALLGKVTAFQMIVVSIIELFFYTLNEHIGAIEIGVVDIGGSMFIHQFGAFFGIALTKVYSYKKSAESKNCGDSYNSNLFSMIGTIFLWMYWPSFNAALALQGSQQHRAVINTVFSLTGSCVFSFIFSGLFNHGKFKMEDILNATLAGGVIIGGSADLCRNPFSALLIGGFGGAVSTIMYNKLTPMLVKKQLLLDTCGVLNLHAIPGLLGGLLASLNVYVADDDSFNPASLEDAIPKTSERSISRQALMQFVVVFITLGISVASGALTGLLLKFRWFSYFQDLDKLYNDEVFWEMEDNEVHQVDNQILIPTESDRVNTIGDQEDRALNQQKPKNKRKQQKKDFVKVVPTDPQIDMQSNSDDKQSVDINLQANSNRLHQQHNINHQHNNLNMVESLE